MSTNYGNSGQVAEQLKMWPKLVKLVRRDERQWEFKLNWNSKLTLLYANEMKFEQIEKYSYWKTKIKLETGKSQIVHFYLSHYC